MYRRISGKILVVSPLHVGAGQQGTSLSTVDNYLITRIMPDGERLPYIPGSSLKGAIRSTVEMILRSMVGKDKCCDVVAKNGACISRPIEGGNKTVEDKIKELLEKESPEEVEKFIEDHLCEACKIFGNTCYASRVYVMDAVPSKDQNGKYMVYRGTRTGVAIDREKGKVETGKLFVTEYVEPSSMFDFQIILDSLKDYQVGLILTALDWFNQGIAMLGGLKSRGMGRVKFILSEPDSEEAERYKNAFRSWVEQNAQ